MLSGINGIDLLILNELLKNPRESFLTISKKVGIAPITVQKRYEKMLNSVC